MGNTSPFTPRFELYNSSTTDFWSYKLQDKRVNPFDFCVNYACENKKTDQVFTDDIGEELEEKGINGYRFHNCVMDFSDYQEAHNIAISDRITYLKFWRSPFSPHQGKFRDLASCVKFFKNLKRLEITMGDPRVLSNELLKDLSSRHLEYLSIEIAPLFQSELFPEGMPKMDSLYNGKTFGDLFLKIVTQTKKINLDDNMWRVLMDRPDVFQKAQEKSGNRILSLETILIDQPNLTKARLQMFTSFCPNGKGTICVREMKNPDNLSRLFQYANQTQSKFKCLQIGWWPSNHPSHPCPTTKLHFWESKYLPVIKQILETTSGIHEISSGMDAVTCAELANLREHIENLGMKINTNGIRVSDKKPKPPKPITVIMTIPSFEFLVKETIKNYSKSIKMYKSAEVWRSSFRVIMEEAFTMCQYLFMKLDHDSEHFENLKKQHQEATSGKRLLTITNVTPDIVFSKLILTSEVDGSEKTFEIPRKNDLQMIERKIQIFKDGRAIKTLKENVESGEVVLPVGLDEFRDGYKTSEIQLKIWGSYDHLDDLLKLMKNWPDSLYRRKLLFYWDFKDPKKLPHFKRYIQTYFPYLDGDIFSELISRAKEYHPYRKYLLEYAEEKDAGFIFEDLRSCYFNLTLLKDYYHLASKKGMLVNSFMKKVFYYVSHEFCNDLDERRKMIEYLCDLVNIGKSGKSIINWAKSVDFSLHNFYNCCPTLMQLGYIREIEEIKYPSTWEEIEIQILNE